MLAIERDLGDVKPLDEVNIKDRLGATGRESLDLVNNLTSIEDQASKFGIEQVARPDDDHIRTVCGCHFRHDCGGTGVPYTGDDNVTRPQCRFLITTMKLWSYILDRGHSKAILCDVTQS
jgi:hypothetical protein